jgi:hypothetical protein
VDSQELTVATGGRQATLTDAARRLVLNVWFLAANQAIPDTGN